MPHKHRVFVGFDPAEMRACNVAEQSMRRHTDTGLIRVDRIGMLTLKPYYTRPTMRMPNGQLFDDISDAPMSTGHAIARFFVPYVCGFEGWALFTDGDVLFREDVRSLFDLADPRYAVQVVQHQPLLEEGSKKDGHIQQAYKRKNWSSVMLFNCGHPANKALTLHTLNEWPGRDLHGFNWLLDELVGALPATWNHLVGLSPAHPNPSLVHFTLGAPDVPGHEHDDFSDEWFEVARKAGYDVLRQEALRVSATK